jgi:hypothetical protein
MQQVGRARAFVRSIATLIASVGTIAIVNAQDRPTSDPPWALNAGFGVDCCSIPDVDSDGKPDVAVGTAYIGSVEPGAVYFISSKTQKPVRRIGGRAGTRMFGEAIASLELPGNPRVSALAVSSRTPCDESPTSSIDVVDVQSGKLLWEEPLELPRNDRQYSGCPDVWMLPLAPAVIARELREKGFLASTVVVCVRKSNDSVELCWIDCAKRERIRSTTCERIPYRTNGHPLCRVGDLDADGVEDIALMGEDRVLVYSAATGARVFEVILPKRPDLSGPKAACKGADYDGDGVSDILIGRSGAQEFVDWGDLSAFSAKTGKLLKRCIVENRGSGFGMSLFTHGTGSQQIVVVGKFQSLEDGVEIVSASTLEKIASIAGVGGDYPEVGAQLFDGADYDGDGVVDLLVSRFDCKSPGEDVGGAILYSGKNYALLGRIELRSVRAPVK